jgi:hypothetical protein
VIRRDYLLRLIDQAVRLFHAILGLVDLRRYPEALAMLNEGYRQFFGMDSDTIMRLPLNYLREQIGNDAEGTRLMATLLETEGDVLMLMEQEEAAVLRWQRGITLLLEAEAQGWLIVLPELPTTIDSLAKRLHPYTLPVDLTAQLFRYYAKTEAFAQAENYLWEWLDTGHGDAEEGKRFYERLMGLEDKVLELGGLSRAEVEAGYEGLMER